MIIQVNGRPLDCKGRTLSDLFKTMKIRPAQVAVVINGEIVPSARRAKTRLAPGDKVELVTLAGGG